LPSSSPFPSSLLPSPKPSPKPHAHKAGKLFIGGVPDGTTAEVLREYASKFGSLADVAVMEGRGFAFVTFADPRHAQAFLEVRIWE
jgi:RNA recognition motif-containing protein